ncbi:ATP-dependent Clp protease ATP-binding subunit ClpX-like [Hibiscus syriacus]|uniref:ATP-dependent Clp protease ATP-binding subunit ClpX-like n=1 Tax=Hibiscus syriacus TaxID=106335 RepID=A0A6A2WC79_HIBSY|nr:ATP-dependent Clp protease ATP-binding subunit ClpX-like [Hibiscus syriacus]
MEEFEKSPVPLPEETGMDESDTVENPETSQKSSSDSDSSDSEDEADQKEQLLTLEYELSTNHSNYDAHVQYIKLLRRSGEIEKLREARENMNTLFPLSPEMWIDWAKDETSLSSDLNFEETGPAHTEYFHRYLSIPLANLKSTLLAYKAWEVQQGNSLDAESDNDLEISSHVASAYQKAEEMYNARAHLEEQITRQDVSESERFQHHLAGNVVKDVYYRATRSCPWVGELWYLDLFLTRVDGLRRRISSASGDDVLSYSMIRESFRQAADYLSPHMKNTDGLLRLHAYWAHLELKLGKDLNATRGVWESLIKSCGSMLEAWKSYISMEIELDHINEARAIYKRCYSKRFSGTGSEDICQSWLRFEREFGTLEDLNRAEKKVTPRLEELQLFRLQQESKCFTGATDQREQTLKNTARALDKRKSGSSAIDDQSPAKRKKYTSQNKKLHKKENTQRLNLAEVKDGEEEKGKVEEQVNEKHIKDTNPKSRLYTDQCTAFVSNMSITVRRAKDEELHQFFSDVGGVTAIRILLDKFTGKSRELAYVDFEDEEHLAAAVAKISKCGRHGSSVSKESGENSLGSRAPRVPQSTGRKRDDNIQLKGKNTFAVPRNVKALGWTANKPGTRTEEDEKPKSNDEFRKMFMKS